MSSLLPVSNRDEARLRLSSDVDRLEEHPIRPHPEARIVVDRAIKNQRFQALAMAHDAQHLVLSAFVVTIAAQRRFGKRRKYRHKRESDV
jgi:hypothetical protein